MMGIWSYLDPFFDNFTILFANNLLGSKMKAKINTWHVAWYHF